jgi:coatomer protein complex subunit gamma
MSNKELLEVIKILETFLVSDSTVQKYSVLKIFNTLLKNQYRKSLIVNVKEIEKVLNDSNTSLSSIAASILLRICSEAYLDTLFTRIEKTMS